MSLAAGLVGSYGYWSKNGHQQSELNKVIGVHTQDSFCRVKKVVNCRLKPGILDSLDAEFYSYIMRVFCLQFKAVACKCT